MNYNDLPSFSCQLLQQIPLVDNIIELSLTRPEGFHWQVGDYLWLGSEKSDFKPFSIANLSDASTIKLQIALVPALNDWWTHLLLQETLQIKGAVNQYHWPKNQQPIMMLAGGTGITPLLALLQGHQKRLEQQLVTLYWGVRRTELLFAREALDSLANRYPNFTWQAVISETDDRWAGLTGLLPDVLAENPLSLAEYTVMICGPWPMVQSIKKWANAQGALADHIQ
jgi:CDP-4-dehydro-6-deoxyglucose reductase